MTQQYPAAHTPHHAIRRQCGALPRALFSGVLSCYLWLHLWCNFVDVTSRTYLPLCLAQESACRLSRACPGPAFRVTTGAWNACAQGTGVYACDPAKHNSSWTVSLRSTLRIMALFVTKSNPRAKIWLLIGYFLSYTSPPAVSAVVDQSIRRS